MNILIDGQTLSTPEINRGIGVYFKNVLTNMMKLSYGHNWYMFIASDQGLNVFEPWVKNNLNVIIDRVFMPGTDYQRSELFSGKINELISDYEIDVLWIPNPLMINVLFPVEKLNCKVFVTIFDLIPVVMPVKEWSKEIKNEYERRLRYLKDNKPYFLFISCATQDDFKKYVDRDAEGKVTLLAADSKKFYSKTNKNRKNNIVFTGGFDYRKNIVGAIDAFIKMQEEYSDDELVKSAILYIVCKYNEADKEIIVKRLERAGVEEKVIFTGYISDKSLAELYTNSSVFFFPSLYEGFGLPILEAMLGGSYILCADNSSLPEVCGEYALLCDANNVEDMAKKLYCALHESLQEDIMQKEKRKEYALSFSWEKTAMSTLSAIEEMQYNTQISKKKKVAVVTPWPDQKTGIANYIYNLIPYLVKYFDIDLFIDDSNNYEERCKEYIYGNFYELDCLDGMYNMYDTILYEIGNNDKYHAGILEKFLKYPGIAEIHDYVLHPFIYYTYYMNGKFEKYKSLLEIGYGNAGENHYKNIQKHLEGPDNNRFPMSHSICKLAVASVFHNKWSKKQITTGKNIFVIPLASFDEEIRNPETRNQIRNQLYKQIKLQENEMIIGCFGFINPNKRPEKVLEAVEQLIKDNYNVKLVFFGQLNDGELLSLIQQKELENKVFITGYLEKRMYEEALEICDIIVNLRYPTMGEASATLCDAFRCAKPVLVSEINQYCEYPDDVCWKVPVNQYEIPILISMLKYLIDHEDVRKALGNNAFAYAVNVLSPEKIAKMYRDILERI